MEYSPSINDDPGLWPDRPNPKEPLPLSIFLVLLFLIGTISVSELPGYNYAVIGIGAICGITFLMASMRSGFFVPSELKCFMAFLIWGLLGIFVARYSFAVFDRLRTLVQLVIMAMIVSYYAQNTRCVSWLFFAMLIGIIITASAGVFTGEFSRAEAEETGETRLVGLTMNANTFARTVTYGIAILLFYFRQVQSKILKLLMIGAILVAIRFVIVSGSRQGFLGLAVLISLWFLFTYGKEIYKRPGLFILMLVVVVLIGIYIAYLMRDTLLMKRLLLLEEGESGKGGVGTRMTMIREGIQFTFSYPVLGLGLNHFKLTSVTGLYAHNNYAEIFSTTGLPGGSIYFMIYILIFYRVHKLRKAYLDPGSRNLVTVIQCMMLWQVFMDIFIVSYYSKTNWILLAIIIGYLNSTQRQVQVLSDPDLTDVYEQDQEYAQDPSRTQP